MIGGPNSGVGTPNVKIPTMSRTVMTRVDGPTIARPSVKTHQKATTTHICDNR